MFEDFIRHARTDRYHLMCSIVAHDKKQPSYEDEERNIGYRPTPKNETTEALEALGGTLHFINYWLKLFDRNYEVRCGIYNKAMKNIFQKIPTMRSKPLIQGKKYRTIVRSWW